MQVTYFFNDGTIQVCFKLTNILAPGRTIIRLCHLQKIYKKTNKTKVTWLLIEEIFEEQNLITFKKNKLYGTKEKKEEEK